MKRYGMVVEVRPERIEEYKELHAAVWPEVLDMVTRCNIRNYSIYLRQLTPGRYYLFSYFEYVGDDFDGDMSRMADDETTQRWWEVCKPCHRPLEDRAEGEWWAEMEEVFHLE